MAARRSYGDTRGIAGGRVLTGATSNEMIMSSDCSAGTVKQRMQRSDTNGIDLSNNQEKHDYARAKCEWRLVAMLADRVFLWVFVVISAITHTILVVQMLSVNSET